MSKELVSNPPSSTTNFLLKLFGCCSDNSLNKDKKQRNPSLMCPTSEIDIANPPNKSVYGSSKASYNPTPEDLSYRDGIAYQKDPNFPSRIYPLNEVFLFGKKYKIVAYITRKKIYKENSVQMSFRESMSSLNKENLRNMANSNGSSKAKWSNLVKNCASLENKKDNFSRDEKVTSSNASYQTTTENLGGYLSSRLKGDVIIDAICGYGETTRQVSNLLISQLTV